MVGGCAGGKNEKGFDVRLTESEFEALMARRGQAVTPVSTKGRKPANDPAKAQEVTRARQGKGVTATGKRQPNKTEGECGRILALDYPGADIRYEAITLYLRSGHAYKADWVVILLTGEVILVEAKNGAYRHASYGRSKLAFDTAKVEFPCFKFQWREKFSDGWRVS